MGRREGPIGPSCTSGLAVNARSSASAPHPVYLGVAASAVAGAAAAGGNVVVVVVGAIVVAAIDVDDPDVVEVTAGPTVKVIGTKLVPDWVNGHWPVRVRRVPSASPGLLGSVHVAVNEPFTSVLIG